MTCEWCSNYGYWICPPPCTPLLLPASQYVGRFRIATGNWRVFTRTGGGDPGVSISACEPGVGPWDENDCLPFDGGAYDVYRVAGQVAIVPLPWENDHDDCAQCDEGDCGDGCSDDGATAYAGRFRVQAGQWKVWCRNSAVGRISISACEPPNKNGPWTCVCCYEFDGTSDYDVWVDPGNPCSVRIEKYRGTDCPECTPDQRTQRPPPSP